MLLDAATASLRHASPVADGRFLLYQVGLGRGIANPLALVAFTRLRTIHGLGGRSSIDLLLSILLENVPALHALLVGAGFHRLCNPLPLAGAAQVGDEFGELLVLSLGPRALGARASLLRDGGCILG